MAFIEGVRLTSPTHLATRLELRLSFILGDKGEMGGRMYRGLSPAMLFGVPSGLKLVAAVGFPAVQAAPLHLFMLAPVILNVPLVLPALLGRSSPE